MANDVNLLEAKVYPFPNEAKVSTRDEYKAALKYFSEDDNVQGWTLYVLPCEGGFILRCGLLVLHPSDDVFVPEPITHCEVSRDPEAMERELDKLAKIFAFFVECGEHDLTPAQWDILGIEFFEVTDDGK